MKKVIILISAFIIFVSSYKLLFPGSDFIPSEKPLTSISINQVQIVTPAVWYATLNYNGRISLLKTTNSGGSWTLYYDLLKGFASLDYFADFHFPDANTGYACGGSNTFGFIAKTTDGGVTWDTINSANSNRKTAIHFASPNVGYVGGAQNYTNSSLNKIFATSTGGDTWVSTMEGNSWFERGISVIANSDATHFFANILFYPFINKNVYGTAGWSYAVQLIGSSITISDIEFNDSNEGIFLCQDSPNTSCLGITTNGLTTYTTQTFYMSLIKACITGHNIYCLKSGNNQLMKSTNLGTNWAYYNYDVQFQGNYPYNMDVMNDYLFVSMNTGNETNAMMRSTNGGVNWSYMTVPPPTSVITGTVKYSDNNQIVTSGIVKAIKLEASSGKIDFVDSAQIDANGKYTLKNLTSDSVYIGVYPNSVPIKDYVISYYSETCDWRNAVLLRPSGRMRNVDIKVQRMQNNTAPNSVNGKIMKSNKSVGNLKDAVVYAKNGNTYVGCAVSDANGVYHVLSLPTGSLKFIATRIGYRPDSVNVTVTSSGNIDSVNFILSRLTSGIRTIGNTVPESYSLKQNYPNPFNPSTVIEFSIPKSGNVFIKLYDVTGREVCALFSGYKVAGNYAIDFNAEGLAGGLYLCRMTVNDFTDTRKMLLIK